jgi:hypothetical protein
MNGSDEHLDNAHLMRVAGRLSRRVRGYAMAYRIPVIDCRRGEHKHDLTEDFLATRTVRRSLLLVLVGRAEVRSWDVCRCSLRQHLVCGASGLDREGASRMIALSRKKRGKMGLTSTPVCGKNRAHAANSWEKPWETASTFSHFLIVLDHLCAN